MAANPLPGNLVVLSGEVPRPPTLRELPDGRAVAQFDVATVASDDPSGGRCSVPVAWYDPTERERSVLDGGDAVVVVGTVQRRFFRAGGSTQSRTEVVVSKLVPARRRKTAEAAIDEVIDRLS